MKVTTNISWWRTSFGQEEAGGVREAISREHLSQGAVTLEFEQRLAQVLDVPYVVATTSGSMAILMALMAAGIKPGDEVIVPNRTWIATAHAPWVLGAKVVLTDVEASLPVMDISKIEEKITPKTKAIIPVHLGGRAVDMQALSRLAQKHGLCLIEDAAQAFCSRTPAGMLGTHSFAGCFSLSVAKLVSTGQGGFLATRSKETYAKLKSLRTHGVTDLVEVVYTQGGFNFRFTDVQAAIGLVQLTRLTEKIEKVNAIYARYAAAMEELPFLKFVPVNVEVGELPLYVEVLYSPREELKTFLSERGIQTRPFYPDLDSADYLGCKGQFPSSRRFGAQGLFLPCGPAQPLENVDYVIETLREFQGQI